MHKTKADQTIFADSRLDVLQKSLMHTHQEMEARVGIEPTNKAFAEPCLTTWLPRLPVCAGKHRAGKHRCK